MKDVCLSPSPSCASPTIMTEGHHGTSFTSLCTHPNPLPTPAYDLRGKLNHPQLYMATHHPLACTGTTHNSRPSIAMPLHCYSAIVFPHCIHPYTATRAVCAGLPYPGQSGP